MFVDLKKKSEFLNKISIKILLSYLSILLIPVALISIIYKTSTDALLEYQQEKNMYGLQETARIMTLRLDELNKIASYIQMDKTTNTIINSARFSEKQQDLYYLHQAINTFPSYNLINQMVRNIYIFFNDMEYVVKLPNAFANNAYTYDLHINFKAISHEEMSQISRRKHMGNLIVNDDETGSEVLLLRSIPDSSSPSALIVIQLNTETIQGLLNANETGENGGTFLMDKEGNLLSFSGNRNFTQEELLELIQAEEPSYREIQQDGETYLLYIHEENRLTYISLVEKNFLLEKIAPIKYVILLLGAGSLFVGVIICITLWQRRNRVVKKISDAAKNAGIDHGGRSEQQLIETTVYNLANTVGTLRETIDRQKEGLQNTTLYNLLQGLLVSKEDMRQSFSSSGLAIESSFYRVVDVLLIDPAATANENMHALAYRIFLKQFLKEKIPVNFFVCDLNNSSFTLLLLENQKKDIEDWKEFFKAISYEIDKKDWTTPSFLISDTCTDVWESNHLYKQTDKIKKYMECLDLRGICTIANLPDTDDAPHFPVYEEIHLIQIIRSGSLKELTVFWTALIGDNLEKRTLGVSMLVELRETLRRTILRSFDDILQEDNNSTLIREIRTAKSIDALYLCAEQAQYSLTGIANRQSTQEYIQTRNLIQITIEENIRNASFSLYILSQIVDISENTLYRSFKNYFGTSFSVYLEQCRISKAVELLREQIPVKEVAEKVGYSSDHTFRRAFKRVLKVSPSQFVE